MSFSEGWRLKSWKYMTIYMGEITVLHVGFIVLNVNFEYHYMKLGWNILESNKIY